MTDADAREAERIDSIAADDLRKCQSAIERLKLKMNLVEVERIFGGQHVVVYYVAETRVDFRQLLKDLRRMFKTNIEMKQIGVRHEAKLVADYGDCGQPVCCSRFLSKMPPVSMKMAKMQRSTLDPNKISGRCGRLKCCLRYEYDTYAEVDREMPSVGSTVLTRNGNAEVIARDLLSRQLTVRDDAGRRIMIDTDEIVSVVRRGGGRTDRVKG